MLVDTVDKLEAIKPNLLREFRELSHWQNWLRLTSSAALVPMLYCVSHPFGMKRNTTRTCNNRRM